MIIVSQDGKAIHNFDNILSLQVEKNYKESLKEEDHVYKIVVYDNLNDYTGLGEYKTEERAKEVLYEIMKATSVKMLEGETLDKTQIELAIKMIPYNIYKMPEE